jgi:hypothetical protein
MIDTNTYKVTVNDNDCLRNLVEHFNWDYKNADLRIEECTIIRFNTNSDSYYSCFICVRAYKSVYKNNPTVKINYPNESEAINGAFKDVIKQINTGARHITAY